MRVQREIFFLDYGRGLVETLIVKQYGAQHGDLCSRIGGKGI
jgi:hypothetical protein